MNKHQPKTKFDPMNFFLYDCAINRECKRSLKIQNISLSNLSSPVQMYFILSSALSISIEKK